MNKWEIAASNEFGLKKGEKKVDPNCVIVLYKNVSVEKSDRMTG
jgi:hypothetical protein